MTLLPRAVALFLLALASPRALPVVERWELEIAGPATLEHGEFRFEGRQGHVVLESADTLLLPLDSLVRSDSTIRFVLTSLHRRFTGTIARGRMTGAMIDLDGSLFNWNAQQILPGANRWPIPPRLTVRQIESGSDAVLVTVPGAWRALLPGVKQLETEYDAIAHEAGIYPWHGAQLQSRSVQIQLGLDTPVRESMHRVIEAIGASPAADAQFRRLFRTPTGWRVDLGDVALEQARRLLPTFALDRAMTPIWKLAPGSVAPIDSAGVREVVWRFWSRLQKDSTLARELDAMQAEGAPGGADAAALMRGYDAAATWWSEAVDWLLTRAWIKAPTGNRSPRQLVASFWGKDSLTLPRIELGHFAAPEAFPSPSVAPLLDRLIRPANAVAPDWLAATPDRAEVLDAWRTLDWGEPFRVIGGRHSRYLTSPAVEARSHVGLLLGPQDKILIDPGVPPLLAVAMVTHEWQHLILTGLRWRGAAPGIRENGDELRFLEDDPWLAEGAAEWASDRILAPARGQAPILLAIAQSRRLALQELASDDPHILGYRLVRAAAGRVADPRVVRDRLVLQLHDLAAFARLSGLAAAGRQPPLRLVRPLNAAVIPEVTFLFDGGAALDVHRRLRVSLSPLEP